MFPLDEGRMVHALLLARLSKMLDGLGETQIDSLGGIHRVIVDSS